MKTTSTKRIAIVSGIFIATLSCLAFFAYHKPSSKGFKFTPSNVKEVLTVDGNPTSVYASVDNEALRTVENTGTWYFEKTRDNSSDLIQFLSEPGELPLFYDSLYACNINDKDYYVLKSKFNYKQVAEALEKNKLTDRNHFNSFVKNCEYRNSSAVDADPITILSDKCGNCNAFTMLTYVYLDLYEPTTEKELVSVFSEEEGYAHIYLKVKDNTGSDFYTVDCTRSQYLK